MSAYVETLCDHCGIVRVGASAPFPAPYRFSVSYVIRGPYAELVGFDHKRITPGDFASGIRAINDATGRLVAYDRAGPPALRVIQIDPALTKGRIVMTRKPHHVSHAIKPDGTVDNHAVAEELRHVADLLDRNLIELRPPTNGVHPEAALGDGWDRLTFERKLHPSLT